MENLSELSGYVASTLVLFTFVAKDMRLLRSVAIFSNVAFITYGTIEWLPPVLFLHMVLLPLNAVRLAEIVRAAHAKGDLIQTDGVPSGQDPACLPPRLAQTWFGWLSGYLAGHPPAKWRTAESCPQRRSWSVVEG